MLFMEDKLCILSRINLDELINRCRHPLGWALHALKYNNIIYNRA